MADSGDGHSDNNPDQKAIALDLARLIGLSTAESMTCVLFDDGPLKGTLKWIKAHDVILDAPVLSAKDLTTLPPGQLVVARHPDYHPWWDGWLTSSHDVSGCLVKFFDGDPGICPWDSIIIPVPVTDVTEQGVWGCLESYANETAPTRMILKSSNVAEVEADSEAPEIPASFRKFAHGTAVASWPVVGDIAVGSEALLFPPAGAVVGAVERQISAGSNLPDDETITSVQARLSAVFNVEAGVAAADGASASEENPQALAGVDIELDAHPAGPNVTDSLEESLVEAEAVSDGHVPWSGSATGAGAFTTTDPSTATLTTAMQAEVQSDEALIRTRLGSVAGVGVGTPELASRYSGALANTAVPPAVFRARSGTLAALQGRGGVNSARASLLKRAANKPVPLKEKLEAAEAAAGKLYGGKIVIYTTSFGAITASANSCRAMRQIFQTSRISFEDRDITMSQDFATQLKERLPGAGVPYA